jgi:predicted DNA-binding protein
LNIAIPQELHEWLKAQAFKQNKTQGLYLTEILELVRKLKDA